MYLSTSRFPATEMSVTLMVGCPAELIVADTLPPSVFTETASDTSIDCIDIATSQSPTKGVTSAGAGAGV